MSGGGRPAPFEDVSAYRFSVVNITGDANPEQVSAAYVSADFFRLFGAAPILGRTFSQDEDRPAGGFTVVLGNGFWRRRFGGDPAVIGRTVLFNGQAHEIIGVLGPFDTTAIQSAVGAPEVWLPFQIDPNSTMQGHFFTTAGRLKPGVSVEKVMKESAGRSGTGFRQNKTRAVLVITEIALALILLVGAALLIRTYIALRAVDPGFNPERVLTMRMSLTGDRFVKTATIGQLMREGRERLEALPEVEAAAASCCVPLQGGFGLGFIIEGRPLDGPVHGGGSFTPISANYFNVFKIPVLRGRYFTEQDTTGAPGVVIINQAMARQYWPDGNPLGERLLIGRGLGPDMEQPPAEIVGVVGDVRDGALNRDPNPIMYIPWAQLPDAHSANLLSITSIAWVVRTRAEPFSLSEAIQKELREASGGLPVARLRSMEDVVSQSTARADFNMLLLTIFAGSALTLAAIGVYGLMAYSVQQRTQEMGVRLALGADASRVRNMVVRQDMTLVASGVISGIAAAFGLAQVMATFLFGVTPRDPLVFVVVPLVLASFAWLGVWLPARRAGRVDPVVALRVD